MQAATHDHAQCYQNHGGCRTEDHDEPQLAGGPVDLVETGADNEGAIVDVYCTESELAWPV